MHPNYGCVFGISAREEMDWVRFIILLLRRTTGQTKQLQGDTQTPSEAAQSNINSGSHLKQKDFMPDIGLLLEVKWSLSLLCLFPQVTLFGHFRRIFEKYVVSSWCSICCRSEMIISTLTVLSSVGTPE